MYQRNVLMQYGPLQFSPIMRSKQHLRFRLIDFGRTDRPDEKELFHALTMEYNEANEHLKLGFY